jgi:hypothetical protein
MTGWLRARTLSSFFMRIQTMQTFDDLLLAARQQAEPQRLLLVFAAAELPGDANDEERRMFEAGHGGALAPLVCVDKRPEEIDSFKSLKQESSAALPRWDILFVSAMDGRGGFAPNSDEAAQPLRMMVEQIKGGRIARFIAVDGDGRLVELDRH